MVAFISIISIPSPLSPRLETFLLLLQCFRCIQFKEQIGYIKGKQFNKSEKMEKSNCFADQDNNEAPFWFYPISRVFKLYVKSSRQIQS